METISTHLDTISEITLNRPKVHNAFDDKMISELTHQFERLSKHQETRVIKLSAKGKHFCAGADLHWMKKMATASVDQNKQDALQLAKLLQLIAQCPKPTIAITQGRAMGGACGLIAACDFVVAEPNSQFCFSEVKLGLIPATIAPYVIRRIGPALAQRFFITAELIKANTAKSIHLIDEVTEADTREDQLKKLTDTILQNGPTAISEVKKLINHLHPIKNNTLEYTAETLATLRASHEAQIGLNAFFAKEKPKWK